MYIIPEFKYCFLASPRTGSKAIAKALVENRGAILIGSHHTTPEDTDYEIKNDWTICSTIRNHWDTMVSWWFKTARRGEPEPLADFLPHFCATNPNFVQDGQLFWKHWPYTNTLLRYECLQADFDQSLVKAGMAPLDLPIVKDSKRDGRPYQIFYKTLTAQWVHQYFLEEIEHCGYKF